MIRKTSLLHKIDPTARRSSFAGVSIGNGLRRDQCRESAPPVTHVTRCARVDLLFTMSDSLRALRQKSRARELIFTNELFELAAQ
jgi:hypothetical protein